MKTFAITAALVAFTTGAVAKNCDGGLSYCTSSLLQKGNYAAQISEALSSANQTDTTTALFMCEGGSDGSIIWAESCPQGCIDGGKGTSDYCAKQAGSPVSQQQTEGASQQPTEGGSQPAKMRARYMAE